MRKVFIQQHSEKGFTLLELVGVLAVAGLLIAAAARFAIGRMQDIRLQNNIAAQAQQTQMFSEGLEKWLEDRASSLPKNRVRTVRLEDLQNGGYLSPDMQIGKRTPFGTTLEGRVIRTAEGVSAVVSERGRIDSDELKQVGLKSTHHVKEMIKRRVALTMNRNLRNPRHAPAWLRAQDRTARGPMGVFTRRLDNHFKRGPEEPQAVMVLHAKKKDDNAAGLFLFDNPVRLLNTRGGRFNVVVDLSRFLPENIHKAYVRALARGVGHDRHRTYTLSISPGSVNPSSLNGPWTILNFFQEWNESGGHNHDLYGGSTTAIVPTDERQRIRIKFHSNGRIHESNLRRVWLLGYAEGHVVSPSRGHLNLSPRHQRKLGRWLVRWRHRGQWKIPRCYRRDFDRGRYVRVSCGNRYKRKKVKRRRCHPWYGCSSYGTRGRF